MKDTKGNQLDPQEVEQDRRRWFEAWKKLRHESRSEIKDWLASMPEDDREDMRRRLNTIHANQKRGYKHG